MFSCNSTKLISVPLIANKSSVHFTRNDPFSHLRSHNFNTFLISPVVKSIVQYSGNLEDFFLFFPPFLPPLLLFLPLFIAEFAFFLLGFFPLQVCIVAL